METSSNIFAGLAKVTSLDVVHVPYEEVLEHVSRLTPVDRRGLLSVCKDAIEHARGGCDDDTRIACVRILVALLPDSLAFISDLLHRRHSSYWYEIHFTLFCYLDWVCEPQFDEALQRGVLRLIEDYLMNVGSPTAMAAWMAGDLLGDHWDVEESFPLLLRVAIDAKYVAGRAGALHGLQMILRNPEFSDDTRRQIQKLLRKISRRDRSGKIRGKAKYILDTP